MIEGVVLLSQGLAARALTVLEDARHQFAQLDASAVAVWAEALSALALAVTDRQAGYAAAVAAASFADGCGCPGALALSLRVMHAIHEELGVAEKAAALEATGVVGLEAFVARLMGAESQSQPAPVVGRGEQPLEVDLTCLGGFSLAINGGAIDSLQVRPRARAVLHILALHAGHVVHRDHILACLWPDDLDMGARSLQVALSSLRRLLEPESERGRSAIIKRKGDCYYLAVSRQHTDIAVFEDAGKAGHRFVVAGAHDEATTHLRRALDLYRGDLFPEAGTAEWVIEPRDRYRLIAVRAAEDLAQSALAQGNSVAAIDACPARAGTRSLPRRTVALSYRLPRASERSALCHPDATRVRQGAVRA